MNDNNDNENYIDLHIHTKLSAWKDGEEIVKNSTKENLPILFQKLNENHISLISFTDHHRFSKEIFLEAKKMIDSKKYDYPKNLIPGVEINFKKNKNEKSIQLNLYFDIDYTDENLNKLEEIFNNPNSEFYLKDIEKYYNEEELDKLLKKIEFNTIIIGTQTSDLSENKDSKNKGHGSITQQFSKDELKQVIKFSYIAALEVQNSSTEGRLKYNFKELNIKEVPLISKSDCHEWIGYPWRDLKELTEKDENSVKKQFSYIKGLPTFRGFLLSLFFGDNWFNPKKNTNPYFYKKILINDKDIDLKNGINCIIGDNGSGKSATLDFLSSLDDKKYDKKYKNFLNSLNKYDKKYIGNLKSTNIKYIKQGEIIESANRGSLFQELRQNINYSEFKSNIEKKIRDWSNSIKNKLEKQIDVNRNIEKINSSNDNHAATYKLLNKQAFHFVWNPNNLHTIENKYKKSLKLWKDIRENIIKDIKNNTFYKDLNLIDEYTNDLLKNLEKIIKKIEYNSNISDKKNEIINNIIKIVEEQKQNVLKISSNQDAEINENNNNKQEIENDIVDYISSFVNNENTMISELKIEDAPEPVNEHGFKLSMIPNYVDKNLTEEFILTMFNSEIKTLNDLKKIKSDEIFIKSVSFLKDLSQKDEQWEKNTANFINKMLDKTRENITDDLTKEKVESTPGELSLAYYKYILRKHIKKFNVLIFDQPEDNISNEKIRNIFLEELNNVRDSKQIILATHNPILVVDLGVDNIIFLEKINDDVKVISGSLDYKDEKLNIMNIIANKLEGGKEAIEARLSLYEKTN